MGCGGFNDLFRVYGNGCNNGGYRTHDYQRDDTQEKISLVKRLYAEGKIDRDSYYSLKEKVYSGRVTFEELIEIQNLSQQQTGEIEQNNDSDVKKYKNKITRLKKSREKVIEVKDKIEERLNELKKEKEKMEEIAEKMVSSSEETAREFIEQKLDLEDSIRTLEKRKNGLGGEIEEIEKTIKVVETKILDYEAVKLQEELKVLKEDI